MKIPQNDIIALMEEYGGSFVRALATAYRRADADNRARLETAFPEVFERYRHMAEKLVPEGR